jgi:formylglycine-generating enzyme required for sulfatase activity
MVSISAGNFTMGSTAAEIDAAFALCKSSNPKCRRDIFEREAPVRKVALDAFFIDAAEVSNAQFAQWLNSSGASTHDQRMVQDGQGRLLADLHPLHGGIELTNGTFRPRAGREKLPVVQVTWWGAKGFCAGQGKRLPTEAQWERSAKNTAASSGGLLFPWGGKKPECAAVCFGGGSHGVCPSTDGPWPVGTSPGDVTGEGIHDLGGNVGEWVLDAFVAPYPGCADSECTNAVVSPSTNDLRVIRGGDWLQPADACRSAGRGRRAADKAEINVGFRCAK